MNKLGLFHSKGVFACGLLCLSLSAHDSILNVAEASPELTLYTARQQHQLQPVLDRYTELTGVRFRSVVSSFGALQARLEVEGEESPADILITVDAGNIWNAARAGLLREVDSPLLNERVRYDQKDPYGRWFGLSKRIRSIVYSTERVSPDQLSTYEDLADPRWKGRLCLRTSKKVYNQSLVASMIYYLGEEKTEEIVAGWVSNLATEPFSSDTRLLKAIAAGQCDVGLANSYYLGRLIKEEPDIALSIFWSNQEDRGVHANLSAAGIARHSKQAPQAQAFLEWLAGDGQALFANTNLEYPVNPSVGAHPIVAAWGRFDEERGVLHAMGAFQGDAIRLMERVNYR